MSLIVTSIRRLKSNPGLHKSPPYISLLCVLGGLLWLLLLPLNRYSRQTYISENALLPGQVHTYFAGSEQNVFRAYREELRSIAPGSSHSKVEEGQTDDAWEQWNGLWLGKIKTIFQSAGLPTATQSYQHHSDGNVTAQTNIYSVLHAPRGDGTEAIVLVAPQYNVAGENNINGVALLLTLARYFKRWSLWSKDIIFLVTPDTTSGPQAWISAYHSTHSPQTVESLSLKSGALQGAVCIDLPFDHRFEKISISYDGVNGQLPNLDLVNTAVSVGSGQMSIGTSIQGMHNHDDSYTARLMTMLRGMANQAVGHGTGAHSVFMPYHIDAITLTAIGDGWQDEMALGRTVESMVRSLNNLLEHFHQSFFFYLLMQTNRFVSIGTYLPSAMAIAAGFTIMAIHLWMKSGNSGAPPSTTKQTSGMKVEPNDKPPLRDDNLASPTQGPHSTPIERRLSLPILLVLSAHLLGLIPFYIFNQYLPKLDPEIAIFFCSVLLSLPSSIASALPPFSTPQYHLTRSISLLILGLSLSTLATLNFSLSLLLGLLCFPLLYTTRNCGLLGWLAWAGTMLASPMGVWLLAYAYFTFWVGDTTRMVRTLRRVAYGWNVLGAWGIGVGVWGVWFPAWLVAAVLGSTRGREDGEVEGERKIKAGK